MSLDRKTTFMWRARSAPGTGPAGGRGKSSSSRPPADSRSTATARRETGEEASFRVIYPIWSAWTSLPARSGPGPSQRAGCGSHTRTALRNRSAGPPRILQEPPLEPGTGAGHRFGQGCLHPDPHLLELHRGLPVLGDKGPALFEHHLHGQLVGPAEGGSRDDPHEEMWNPRTIKDGNRSRGNLHGSGPSIRVKGSPYLHLSLR